VERAPSREAIQRLIETASKESDMQIAFVHWGTEYEPLHSAFQEDLAKILIDAGAEVVIGHHPHVVQDIALYKGKPIFYSLGNFIFDQYFSEAVQDGLMVDFTPEGGAYHFTLLPVTSRYSRSQPMLMLGDERKAFLIELAAKSEPELQEMIVEGNITLKTR
jgi:poly-gamma-glutamate synthesis protein (capsule biosynthesis protein)